MDPAVAGLLGALVGGAATFGGTVVTNAQQTRRDRTKQRNDLKVEAYSNSIRSLLRVAHRRSTFSAEMGAVLGKDIIASWFDDIVEAEYWLTILTSTCGSQQRGSIQNTAQELFQDVDQFTSSSGRSFVSDKHHPNRTPLGTVSSAYKVVAEAARQDIGFVN